MQELVLSEPTRTLTEKEVEELQLQYYNTEVHRAAFTVPQFAKKVGAGDDVISTVDRILFYLSHVQALGV